jgi:hypothetical protein
MIPAQEMVPVRFINYAFGICENICKFGSAVYDQYNL